MDGLPYWNLHKRKIAISIILMFLVSTLWQREILEQCLAICPNCWKSKQWITGFCNVHSGSVFQIYLSIYKFELISEWQDMLMMGSGFQFTDEINLLIFEFWLSFLSTSCLISSVEIKRFMFFMANFVKPVWARGFAQELPGKVLFISFSNATASFSVYVWMATTPFRRV